MCGPPFPARITVPVDTDRAPAATLSVATTLARQGGLAVEFVGVSGTGRAQDPAVALRARCREAIAAGAADASWAVLERAAGGVGWYATWSGTSLLCFGVRRHRVGGHLAAPVLSPLGGAGVPVLVVGPRARACVGPYRRLVVALDGSATSATIAKAAAALAAQLHLRVVFTEVFAATRVGGDVHESAFLHGIAATVGCRSGTFDTLHDRRPAHGIVDFADHDEPSIIAVGMPSPARRSFGGHVASEVIRRARCPVLLIPVGRATARAATSAASL